MERPFQWNYFERYGPGAYAPGLFISGASSYYLGTQTTNKGCLALLTAKLMLLLSPNPLYFDFISTHPSAEQLTGAPVPWSKYLIHSIRLIHIQPSLEPLHDKRIPKMKPCTLALPILSYLAVFVAAAPSVTPRAATFQGSCTGQDLKSCNLQGFSACVLCKELGGVTFSRCKTGC